jgi:Holliday junction resolvase RusA-like endonuclease
MMERRTIRPLEDLLAYRNGSRGWIVALPGGREIRYTNAELERYFGDAIFQGSLLEEDPEPVIRQGGFQIPGGILEILLDTTPQSILRPNSGATFSKWAGKQNREEKARVRKAAKEAAEKLLERMETDLEVEFDYPLYADTAKVDVLVEWEKVITPRYKNGRYRPNVDPHDALPMMCKGIIDGLTDAGIIADDRHIDATYDQGKDPAGSGRVVIKVQGGSK